MFKISKLWKIANITTHRGFFAKNTLFTLDLAPASKMCVETNKKDIDWSEV